MRIKLLILLPILLFMWLPGQVQGQYNIPELIDWQELKTKNFIIVYADSVSVQGQKIVCACGIKEARNYAAFVEKIYGNFTAVFGISLEPPINLRLFPTEKSYYEVNPLAKTLVGVIAHTINSKKEISIALPRTKQLNRARLINNMRHELTHLFASTLSAGKLNAGFQEGIAQYLEKPHTQSEIDPVLLSIAFNKGNLLSWAELDMAEQVYSDPKVAYPQALSVVAFLVDRYGFSTFLDFLKATARKPGYRTALETVYQKSADTLEAEWLAYLPDYFKSRWKINAIYSYDLSRVVELVDKGAYTDSETELVEITTLLASTDQYKKLAQAEELLTRARQGKLATTLADESLLALQNNDYVQTIDKGKKSIAVYQELDYLERIPDIQLYIQWAKLGQNAVKKIDESEQMLHSLQFWKAENEIHNAVSILQKLRNQEEARRGIELLTESTHIQKVVAYTALFVALALLLINSLRRLIKPVTANPLDLEFT